MPRVKRYDPWDVPDGFIHKDTFYGFTYKGWHIYTHTNLWTTEGSVSPVR